MDSKRGLKPPMQVRGPAQINEQCGGLICWIIRPITRKKMINLYDPDMLINERVTWKSNIKLPDCWLIPIRPPENDQGTVEAESLPLQSVECLPA